MSVEIIIEPASNLRKQSSRNPCSPSPRPKPVRCPPGCVPAAAPRCPPGCVPAPRPAPRICYERVYKCRPVQPDPCPPSPALSEIINNQLRKIQSQSRPATVIAASPLERTQSVLALPSYNASSSGYALSHAATASASVEQLPAAIKQVLNIADSVVPRAGNVTYINARSCLPAPAPAPPAPAPAPAPIKRSHSYKVIRPVKCVPRRRSYSPYEVLPVIHVDRCDPCDPCNRNRRLPADCTAKSSRIEGGDIMEIEIEISNQ